MPFGVLFCIGGRNHFRNDHFLWVGLQAFSSGWLPNNGDGRRLGWHEVRSNSISLARDCEPWGVVLWFTVWGALTSPPPKGKDFWWGFSVFANPSKSLENL
eukprot:EG_transcript_12962